MEITEVQQEVKLNKEQQEIATHDGAQIVVAGAGTGKTEALTHHIMYLLLKKKYELREVVAMTFTEKAAAEMRERVYQAISKKVSSLNKIKDYEELYRLNQLRRDFPSQNRITTIDGFNAGLLSAYPEYSPLPPDYQIVDDYSEFILKTETKRAFLNAIEKEDILLEQFMGFHEQMDQHQLFDTIMELAKEDPEELRELHKYISRQEFENQLRLLIPAREQELWDAYKKSIPNNIPDSIGSIVGDKERAISALTEKGLFRKNWLDKNTDYPDYADNWPQETAMWFAAWREYRKPNLPIIDKDETVTGFFEYDWLCHQTLQKLAAMALLYQDVERKIILRHGRVRFQDVANAALQMLQSHPKLAQDVSREIRHILVDEFQDTSLTQWNLIQILRGEDTDNVMLVGDPKQSIYRFRGADVTVFNKVRTTEFTPDQQRELIQSQRARPPLVAFYNALFSRVLSTKEDRPAYEAAHQDLQIADRKQAEHDAATCKGGVTWIESTFEDDGLTLENTARTLAMFLRSLQEDARALAQGEKKVLLPEYADIVEKLAGNKSETIGVLFATHKEKTIAEKVLRDHGVQFSSYHGRGFYDSMPVLLAINLARFFDDPQDNLALAGILRSPLCGVSDVLLTKLSLQNRDLWQALEEGAIHQKLFPNDHRLLVQVVEMLNGWRDVSRVLPFSDVLEKVWDDSWLPLYFELENDNGQQEENFHKLVDILRKAQREQEYGLSEIIAFLQTLRQEKAKEAQAELPDGGSVQLMTLHASKGIGFHMTILAQMNMKPGTNQDQVRSGELGNPPQKYFSIKNLEKDSKIEATLWSLLKGNEAALEKAELRRELYVACTRAKEHLVLLTPAKIRPESWGWWVDSLRNTHVLQKFTYEQLQQLKYHWRYEAGETATPDFGEVQKPLDGTKLPAEISVSQLLDHLFPQAEKDIEVMEELETQSFSSRAKERGSLIHRLLEWDGKSTSIAIENLMRRYNLPVKDTPFMQELAQSVREQLLQLPFDHPNAKQESAFILPAAKLRECLGDRKCDEDLRNWLGADNNWCNGIIDYLVPLQSGGYAVLDFKTHWNPAVQYSEETRERIQTQLQLYAAAAQQLNFDVKQLYAMRIYGNSGEIRLEEFDL